MKLLLGTLFAAVMIAPLAFTGQQESATSPAQLAKCEEGCDCEKCKKKDDAELLADKCKEGCDCDKCQKKDDAELLADKCKEGCDCDKCAEKKEDKALAHCGKCSKDKDHDEDDDDDDAELLAA